MSKAKPQPQGKPRFTKKLTIRLDDDVQAMLNNSARRVSWASANHAANAILRNGGKRFTDPQRPLKINPFEQLVFARKITIRCTKEKSDRR